MTNRFKLSFSFFKYLKIYKKLIPIAKPIYAPTTVPKNVEQFINNKINQNMFKYFYYPNEQKIQQVEIPTIKPNKHKTIAPISRIDIQ